MAPAAKRADDVATLSFSLKKTCQKNAISFWAYLGDRLGIAANSVASLTDIIRARATTAAG